MSTTKSSQCYGIFPTDIVVRGALKAAYDEMRDQPWLLDFAFQAYLYDELTAKEYGERELEACRDWFLNNEVVVSLGYDVNQISQPHVAIWLGNQDEAEATTGDTHDSPSETVPWVVGKQAVVSLRAATLDPATGWITGIKTTTIFPGMQVLDKAVGKHYEILDVEDGRLQIAAGVQLNLRASAVHQASDLWNITLESRVYRETLTLDIVCSGPIAKLWVLHAATIFALNRYNQAYLEGRGFDRMSLASGPVSSAQDGQNAAQIMYKRSITLTGYTRQYWPKTVSPQLQGITAFPGFDGGADSLSVVVTDPETLGS